MKSWEFFKKNFGDLFIIGILLFLIIEIIRLISNPTPEMTDWLLVYLTGIYALFAFYLAAMSAKSALAMERSAKAMEDSLIEARMTRWAQFGAPIQLSNFETYNRNYDGSISIEISNILEQPILNIVIAMWETEQGSSGNREIKYSSMMQSKPRSVTADEKTITLFLKPVNIPESEKVNLGNMALDRFKQVFNNNFPQNSLFIICNTSAI